MLPTAYCLTLKKRKRMENKQVATVEPSQSERFTNMLMKEFSGTTGDMAVFNDNKKRLGQHLFIKADSVLKELEKKRLASNKTTVAEYTWKNVNLSKMSLDAVHRIELGLDPLIDNHISIIPYFNSKLKKYDLDLRIGYAGKDYYKRKMAYETPEDIIYELVYSNDSFVVFKKDKENKVESYEFKIKDPFDRGNIIGGFGYIRYNDESKNKLVTVSEADFKKSESEAKSAAFWGKYPREMRYKTIVNRTTDKLMIDPVKVNESYFNVEEQDKQEAVGFEENEQITEVSFEDMGDTEQVKQVEDQMQPDPIKDKPEPQQTRKASF